MAIEAGIDFHELSDLVRSMYRTAEKVYPKQAKKFLQKEGNKGKRILKDQTKKATGIKTGNLLDGIGRRRVSVYNGDFQIRVYNDAPHAHLIEHGHSNIKTKASRGSQGKIAAGEPVQMVPGGGTPLFVKGQEEKWVPGKHPGAKTTMKLKEVFPKDVETFVDQLLAEGFEL